MSSEDVLRPAGADAARPRKPRISPALSRLAKRALHVDDDEIRCYVPTELDLQMAEAMLTGATTFTAVAEQMGCDPSTVSRAMKDPVRCGWISMQLQRIVSKRIGLVDAALLSRALGGDVRAIKLFYERHGELVHRSHITTTRLDFDPAQLTDDDLDVIIASERARHAKPAEFTVASQEPQEPPGATPESGGLGTLADPSDKHPEGAGNGD